MSNPTTAARFSPRDRATILRTAKAISPTWGAFHFNGAGGAGTAAIGPLAGGSRAWDARDAFGLMAVRGGGVELLDLVDTESHAVYPALGDALAAMAAIVVKRSAEDGDGRGTGTA